jgi:hypothetical protein
VEGYGAHGEDEMNDIDIPSRIQRLPRNPKGFPIPWFVWIDDDGMPDFRVIGPGKIRGAIIFNQCWVCGERLGKHMAFVIGPMCAINRVSSEPPSHRDCAIFAARACPFLTTPKMHRNQKDLPEVYENPAGIGSPRNPGVALIWVTKTYHVARLDGGILFDVGDPVETLWFTEGRPSTREEVLQSIRTGLPALRELAELDGPAAIKDLEHKHQEALKLIAADNWVNTL